MRKIYLQSYAIRPSVRVSADTISYGYGPQHGSGFTGTRTYAEVLQDWDGWMREGILDTNIVMNYKRQLTVNQDVMFQEWSDYAKDHQYGRFAVIECRNGNVYGLSGGDRPAFADTAEGIAAAVGEGWTDEATARRLFDDIAQRGEALAQRIW